MNEEKKEWSDWNGKENEGKKVIIIMCPGRQESYGKKKKERKWKRKY